MDLATGLQVAGLLGECDGVGEDPRGLAAVAVLEVRAAEVAECSRVVGVDPGGVLDEEIEARALLPLVEEGVEPAGIAGVDPGAPDIRWSAM